MNIDYIPYKLETIFLEPEDELKLLSFEPCFMDKRKFNKQKATREALNQVHHSLRGKARTKEIELVNSGFSLELSEDRYCFIIHHPELPETKYPVIKCINYKNWIDFFLLMRETREMRGRKLVGDFYFDPKTNFFWPSRKLDSDFIEHTKIGKLLNGSWKKVVPGHKYYIEIGPGTLTIKEAIFLGTLKDIKLRSRSWSAYYIDYPEVEFNIIDPYTILKPVNLAYLFYEEQEDKYFLCSKSEIRGVDLGDTGKVMSETEFYDMALQNKWLPFIKSKEVFNEAYSEKLIDLIDTEGPVFKTTWGYVDNEMIDLEKQPVQEVFETIKKLGATSLYSGNLVSFVRLASPEFDLDDEDIKNILHTVYTHYGWKES